MPYLLLHAFNTWHQILISDFLKHDDCWRHVSGKLLYNTDSVSGACRLFLILRAFIAKQDIKDNESAKWGWPLELALTFHKTVYKCLYFRQYSEHDGLSYEQEIWMT